jgi:DNA-binding MarR family transcriptional regulator
MPTAPFLPVVRELATTYQAFEAFSSRHIRSLDLTPAQFDIIATLGNTPGMAFKELGEKTLITKGTLTGVVDRLADKQLVRRTASASDGRSQIVQLTRQGEALFARVFPEHLAHLQQAFGELSPDELVNLEQSLRRLREVLTGARHNTKEPA